jgi:hypothetical protein
MADKIDELAAMGDEELGKVLGIAQKLTAARKDLDEMAKLDGEARKEALKRVERMFAPHVHPEEFSWITKDVLREQERKAAKASKANCDCTGSDLLSDEMYPNLD